MALDKTKTTRKRSITIYPPIQEMKDKWFEIAKQEGLSVSNFIIEVVEEYIQRKEGFSSKDDSLPKRILEESLPDGPPAGKIVGNDNFLKMRTEYYLCRGWDKYGVPTKETIAKYKFNGEQIISP